ncbi:coiled-coil domain-containing protein 73 [Alligator mississippiensis]|uniref:coiled-coil domain-containing protein 73 n=1 Tax=Alligator mississippiensis TaxID=8496 RepID=UPI000906F88B|nr:coiled-coil domain-containing protein 73 [Alligator mississippiensis]
MDKDFKTKKPDYTFQSSSETLFSIQLLDFKTSLLEAVEELRIRRDAEIHYEDQINKIVLEKQELEWQKETLQHQTETSNKQHKEAMAAYKKQVQARLFTVEEEKGKYQLVVETKEKEIDGLKEILKTLQISKYTLQKKLNEMDQKLQLHLMAKEEHHRKLNEVEKCYATITCQFGMIKGAHEKLEQNVVEAIQLNKKLTSVNKRQESEINNLKKELKKVTTDLIRSKVTCQYRVGEENINLTAKEQQLQELQQKIRMESVISKRVNEENAHIREEKQEIMRSLQHMQQLLQRLTQTNVRLESELNALKANYKTLERDNELQREKAKENEEKFLNLQNEHEEAVRTWKKDEENMTREVNTIKNELLSLKGAFTHLQDCHSPQTDQHAGQEENLQNGEAHSEVIRIQTSQREDEYYASYIKNDSISEQEENGVKNIVGHSSDIDKVQAKQSNDSTEEANKIIAEGINTYKDSHTLIFLDLQVLENCCIIEDKPISPCEKKQREVSSPSKTFCTDVNLSNQGYTWEICVAGCKEVVKEKMYLEKSIVNAKVKAQDSPCSPTKLPDEIRKMLLDNTEASGVFNEDAGQQTGSSKHTAGSTTNELVCNTNDKADITPTQYEKDVFIKDIPNKECSFALGTEKESATERTTSTPQAKTEFNFAILSQATENNQTTLLKCSLQDNGKFLDDKQCKTEQIQLLNRSTSGISSDTPSFKQTRKNVQERCNDENASKTNENCMLNSTCDTIIDAPVQPTFFCDNASADSGNTNEKNTNNISMIENVNVGTEKPDTLTKLNDTQSDQPEQDTTEQTGNAINKHVCTDVILPLNTEKNWSAQSDDFEIVHKQNFTNKITTVKHISCEKDQLNDTQISNIKGRQPSMINDNNAVKNTLLKEEKESLNNTVAGAKFAEGHLEESCSLPIRTSGDLENRSGRSSFDLSTSDKKTEKTPVDLKFLDLGPWSKVNHVESQTMRASTSKAPFLLKEKLLCLSENKEILSSKLSHTLSVNAVTKETGLDSTSINRVADTLNTSSIHRDPKRDPSEEWNAIAKTFYDSSFPTEHVKPGLTTALCYKQKSCMTYKANTPILNESSFEDDWNTQNNLIKNQIKEIEKFLDMERLRRFRKRKYEESTDAVTEDKTDI